MLPHLSLVRAPVCRWQRLPLDPSRSWTERSKRHTDENAVAFSDPNSHKHCVNAEDRSNQLFPIVCLQMRLQMVKRRHKVHRVAGRGALKQREHYFADAFTSCTLQTASDHHCCPSADGQRRHRVHRAAGRRAEKARGRKGGGAGREGAGQHRRRRRHARRQQVIECLAANLAAEKQSHMCSGRRRALAPLSTSWPPASERISTG